jgi:hypothetical protein
VYLIEHVAASHDKRPKVQQDFAAAAGARTRGECSTIGISSTPTACLVDKCGEGVPALGRAQQPATSAGAVCPPSAGAGQEGQAAPGHRYGPVGPK